MVLVMYSIDRSHFLNEKEMAKWENSAASGDKLLFFFKVEFNFIW